MYLIRYVIEHISNNNNNATTLSGLYSTVYFKAPRIFLIMCQKVFVTF